MLFYLMHIMRYYVIKTNKIYINAHCSLYQKFIEQFERKCCHNQIITLNYEATGTCLFCQQIIKLVERSDEFVACVSKTCFACLAETTNIQMAFI